MAPRSRLHWSVNIRDYRRDTTHLKGPAMHGAYMLLLMHYWEHGGLPNDDEKVRRILGVQGKIWKQMLPILKAFFYDGWKHRRVERDLARAATYSARQSKAALQRWQNIPGDKRRHARAARDGANRQRFQTDDSSSAMPPQCSNRIDRIPSITASPDPVDNSPPMRFAPALPTNKNNSERRAQQKWEAELKSSLGYQHHSKAIEVLAKDPDLVSRATADEMKRPGLGVTTALRGLTGKLIIPAKDLDE